MYSLLIDFWLTYQVEIINLTLLTSFYFLTWGFALTCKEFCIDDTEGVMPYSDRFVQTKDKDGKIIKEEVIDYYEFEDDRYIPMGKYGPQVITKKEVGKKDNQPIYRNVLRCKNHHLNPYLEFAGIFLRWFRINWGRRFKVIGKNTKGHEVFGYVQDPQKHHLLNLLTQYANVILAYFFLSKVFGQEIAIMATILFAVYPLGCQTVAWISGVNYLFCLFGMLATYNSVVYLHSLWLTVPLTFIFTSFSCLTLLPGCFSFIILLLLGRWVEAGVAFLIGSLVVLNQGRQVISYRAAAFKAQNMGHQTPFELRKILIMFKTIW